MPAAEIVKVLRRHRSFHCMVEEKISELSRTRQTAKKNPGLIIGLQNEIDLGRIYDVQVDTEHGLGPMFKGVFSTVDRHVKARNFPVEERKVKRARLMYYSFGLESPPLRKARQLIHRAGFEQADIADLATMFRHYPVKQRVCVSGSEWEAPSGHMFVPIVYNDHDLSRPRLDIDYATPGISPGVLVLVRLPSL